MINALNFICLRIGYYIKDFTIFFAKQSPVSKFSMTEVLNLPNIGYPYSLRYWLQGPSSAVMSFIKVVVVVVRAPLVWKTYIGILSGRSQIFYRGPIKNHCSVLFYRECSTCCLFAIASYLSYRYLSCDPQWRTGMTTSVDSFSCCQNWIAAACTECDLQTIAMFK